MPSIKILDAASATTFVETFNNASGTTLMASVPINSSGTALGGLQDSGNGLPAFLVGGTATISGALPAGTNALGTVSALQSGVWTALLSGGTTTISGALPAGTNALGTVSITQALPAGTNAIGTVSITGTVQVQGLGGAPATSFAVVSASGAVVAAAIKSAGGTVFGINVFCTNTANSVYLRLYNLATGSVNGTSVPNLILGVPSGGVNNATLPISGVGFATAISYQITKLGVANDTTAVNASDLVGWVTYI